MPDTRECVDESVRATDEPAPRWLPLTAAQKGMWLAQRFGPKRAVFNIAEVIEIQGAVDAEIFYRAVAQVILEIPSTRLRFIEVEGEPRQCVSSEPGQMLPLADLSDLDDPRAAAIALMREELQEPHDPLSDVLFIVGLFKLSEDRYFWYQRGHHICFDGYSGGLVARRTAEVYSQMLSGQVPAFTPFADIEELLREEKLYCQSDRFEADRDYWMREFADKPAPTSLTTTRPSMDGGLRRHTTMLDAHFVDGLRSAAASAQCTFPQLMIAAIAIYLYRMTGVEDLVLGLPVTARSNGRLRRIPCMLANAVPLRLSMRPDQTASAVMRHVAKRVREALRHQRYRYEDIRRDLNLAGAGRHLFTTVVNIEPFDYDLRMGDAPTRIENLCNGSIEDLAVFVFDRGEHQAVQIDLDANPAIYPESVLQQHGERLRRLLEALRARIDSAIATIPIMDPADTAAVLRAGAPPAAAPELRYMPEDFERQAAQTPWAVAATCGYESVTYRALEQRANQIAHALAARGAGADRVVGVCVPRCIDMIASLLAVMKSGAAYLPLDPDLPQPRLQLMLGDARPDVVIATQHTLALVEPYPVLVLDDALHGLPTTWERPPFSPHQPAYLIYTSGSTGNPKGVVLSRENLANFLGAMLQEIPIDPSDRLLAVTTISFDIAALEIYLPLVSGARVILAPKGLLTHPPALARLIAVCGATIMQATPSLWDTLTGSEAEALRGMRILTGGEALPPRLAAQLRDIGAEVINLYGPTETTIWSAVHRLQDGGDTAVGRPIARTQLLVLDSGLMPTPEGIAGELYIAGAGLAHGYLNRPGLTATRFVANPHGPPGSLMYRTGDIARFQRGVLHYVGRADGQVKVRGFRVELAEIEGELRAEPGVLRAAVVMRDGRLTGYVVPAGADVPLDEAKIKSALRLRLPDYLVPSTLVVLPELPLSPSGKLDRRALPEPSVAPSGRTELTATEEKVIALFCEKLGRPDIDVDANIFELGADSLTVAKIIAHVRATFAVELSLAAVYENSTVAGFAALIDNAESRRAAIVRQIRPARIPLSSSQLRMLRAWETPGIGAAYNMNLGLVLNGPLDASALEAAASDVMQRHEALRTIIDLRGDEPAQVIMPAAQARMHVIEEGEIAASELLAAMNVQARRPFDITAELPLRLHLWRIGTATHGLLAVVHHIAADGASLAPLAADLSHAYAARVASLLPQWEPLPLQYADFALWERAQRETLASQLGFWRKALDALPTQIPLPTDRPYPQQVAFAGGLVPVQLSAGLHADLLRLARAHGASLFMVLQAGFAALLHRLGAGIDIPIGSPVAGRSDGQLEALIGCFYNVLVLRTDLSGNPAFTTLIERIRAFNLRAYANQDAPFDRVLDALKVARPPDRHPLFQVMLSFQNIMDQKFDMANLAVSTVPVSTASARYDLTLNLSERHDSHGQPAGISGGLEFRSDLFGPATASRLVVQLQALLQAAAADPSRCIVELCIECGTAVEASAALEGAAAPETGAALEAVH